MTDDIRNLFGRNLSNQLYVKGKTQADICKHLNVSSATASDWCNGKKIPRLDKIQSICTYLGIEKSDLLENKEKVLTDSARTEEFMNLFKSLDDEKQKDVLKYAKFLLSEESKDS